MNNTLRTFYILTVTQVLSMLGSIMTGIAVGIWVFEQQGTSTPLLLNSFFAALPLMIGGSLAGVLVDRWQRRRVLIASDLGQAVCTVLLLLSFASGAFQLWHLYVLSFFQGLLGMVQRPAMEASVTMLVPEGQRDRANAIRQITGPAAGMVAPVITGLVYGAIGVVGVMVIDLLTFVLAIVVVWLVHIPQPSRSTESSEETQSLWQDMRAGLAFLWARPVLLMLMGYAAVHNLLLVGPINLSTPYIMTLTHNEAILGLLLGCMNVGIVVGGVAVMIWGGTRPRIHGMMLGLLFRALWLALYGLARTPFWLGAALFFVFSTNALVDASNMSIMQSKIPPGMQGRVFALLFQMMYIANPLSYALTGPLVDRVLEPAVATAGWRSVAWLVGQRPGSGMGLLMVIAGLVNFVLTAGIYAWPRTRHVEAELPGYE